MPRISPLHVSYSASLDDGGIATSVSQLLKSQQAHGLFARWIASKKLMGCTHGETLSSRIQSLDHSVLHLHGLWRRHTRELFQLNHLCRPAIIAPHGMLDRWAMANSSFKKLLAWHLWEKKSLSSALCFHALCNAEADAIREYLPKMPIAVIPNGVLPFHSEHLVREDLPPPPWSAQVPESDHVLLYLGRFHPKKGIEPLISAWQSIVHWPAAKHWWLVFIGFGDDGKLQDQMRSHVVDRCIVLDPVFGRLKQSCLSAASSFVLPSYSEGLPMAALEAMSASLPCLLTRHCNLPQAFISGAALEIEPNQESIISGIKQLFALSPKERTLMGRAGSQLVNQEFHWPSIAQQTLELYAWLADDMPRPDFVWEPA